MLCILCYLKKILQNFASFLLILHQRPVSILAIVHNAENPKISVNGKRLKSFHICGVLSHSYFKSLLQQDEDLASPCEENFAEDADVRVVEGRGDSSSENSEVECAPKDVFSSSAGDSGTFCDSSGQTDTGTVFQHGRIDFWQGALWNWRWAAP